MSYNFKSGDLALEITHQNNYLGLSLTEFLSYDIMASNVAKFASRAALGLVIIKVNRMVNSLLNVLLNFTILWYGV